MAKSPAPAPAKAPEGAEQNDAPAAAAIVYGAALLSAATACNVEKGSLIIVSRQAGLRRAGLVHPGVAVYPISRFKDADLARLRAEPLLEVIEIL